MWKTRTIIYAIGQNWPVSVMYQSIPTGGIPKPLGVWQKSRSNAPSVGLYNVSEKMPWDYANQRLWNSLVFSPRPTICRWSNAPRGGVSHIKCPLCRAELESNAWGKPRGWGVMPAVGIDWYIALVADTEIPGRPFTMSNNLKRLYWQPTMTTIPQWCICWRCWWGLWPSWPQGQVFEASNKEWSVVYESCELQCLDIYKPDSTVTPWKPD